MQQTAVRPHYCIPLFSDGTQRDFELQSTLTSQVCHSMFGPTGMAVGPFVMPTSVVPGPDHKIHDLQSKRAEKAQALADSDNSMKDPALTAHAQEHFSPTSLQLSDEQIPTDGAMTHIDLRILPPSNASYQMAYFLKTTGPPADSSTKSEKPKRKPSTPRGPFSFFKSKEKRAAKPQVEAHDKYGFFTEPTKYIC